MRTNTDLVGKHSTSDIQAPDCQNFAATEICPRRPSSATQLWASASTNDDWTVLLTLLDGLSDRHGSAADPLRCWVPACGTGELAYSIAILLAEAFGAETYHRRFKIFATGLRETELATARKGLFSKETFDHLPDNHHYLHRDRKVCRIDPSIRETITFSQHDPFQDPPISNLDLICSGLLLHQVGKPAQEHFIQLFHYILNPGGYVWIGGIETIQGLEPWFEPLNGRWSFMIRSNRDRVVASELYGKNYRLRNRGLSKPKEGQPSSQLECNKEELQTSIEALEAVIVEKTSLNEELTLVNQQLHTRSEELSIALKQLAASEAHYRSVVEDQSEMICRYRPDGTITFVNTAFAEAMKGTKVDLLGTSFADWLPDDTKLQSRLGGLTPDNPVRTLDCRVASSGEQDCWQHWTDRALFDHEGQVVEYQSVGEDISARVEAESLCEKVSLAPIC